MRRRSRFPEEVRDRAIRMVMESEGSHSSQWAAIVSVAEKIGCAPETLRNWVRRVERDTGQRQEYVLAVPRRDDLIALA